MVPNEDSDSWTGYCEADVSVHGVDCKGKVVLRKRLRRAEVASFFAGLEPCLIGLSLAVERTTGFVRIEPTGAHGAPDRAAVSEALRKVTEE